jgi:hypothetical protein
MKGTIVEKAMKNPTKKQLENNKKAANNLEKQLMAEYQETEQHLHGQQPQPEILANIIISEGEDLWQEAIDTISQLGEQHHIDLQVTTVANYTTVLTFDHVQSGQWPEFTQLLRTEASNNQHRPSAARTAIHKIQVLKLAPDERQLTAANREHLWILNTYASSASEFTHWVADPFECTLPAGYPNTRLRRALVWLQTFEEANLPKAREMALKRLKEIWVKHKQIVGSWENLKRIWTEEATDKDLIVWQLPLWDDTSAGSVQEEWDCYAGAVMHLNKRLGYKLLDLKLKS